MEVKYLNLINRLNALGATNPERAKVLGVSLRTFIDYKRRPQSIPAKRLVRAPELIDALKLDATEPAEIAA